MKKIALIIIIGIELTCIIWLGVIITRKNTRNLFATVIPLRKEDLQFPANRAFKHFYEPTPNTRKIESPYDWLPHPPTYTINSDSLNERFNYTAAKPPHVYRIITLGDSFTYGLFVNTHENYPETLEGILSANCKGPARFEVINLALPGYDIEYSVERFRLRGQKYNPDLVIWLLKHDDFDEISELTLGLDEQYQREIRAAGPIDTITLWQNVHQKSRDYLRDTLGREGLARYDEHALNRLNTYYQNPLLIYSLGLLHSEMVGAESLVDAFVQSRPATYFYESSALAPSGLLLPDGHPNALGHAAVARDLFRYLTANNLIPCL